MSLSSFTSYGQSKNVTELRGQAALLCCKVNIMFGISHSGGATEGGAVFSLLLKILTEFSPILG
jgi:hypothetical protein